ncbi:hypothetical protein FKW77_001816 [Venturia effusa]|uniref:Uncharacterized protein n=1 Tax=Venturia effusa TaxID=50376 RepID=A0A517KZ47_9PEZI|nr:hypothetical protein FKW77_001816 [Venturia effusa]
MAARHLSSERSIKIGSRKSRPAERNVHSIIYLQGMAHQNKTGPIQYARPDIYAFVSNVGKPRDEIYRAKKASAFAKKSEPDLVDEEAGVAVTGHPKVCGESATICIRRSGWQE